MDHRIERVEITSFGKLKNVSFAFGEGINLLSAPNESGKSTVAAFLRFALYGFSDGRKQTIAENDRKLYTPWEQPRAEGTLYFKSGDTVYRIFRSCSGTKETLEVTDEATGKPVSFGEEPGKALLGVSEEVFSRTLFFRQQAPPQNKDGVLAEQLQTLAVSADEQLGSVKATERLKKAQNTLRGRAGAGVLPRLEQESARLEGALAEALADHKTLNTLRADAEKARTLLEENRAVREKTEREMQRLVCFEAAQTLDKVEKARKEADASRAAYREAAACIRTRGKDDAAFLASLISRNASLRALQERQANVKAATERNEAELASSEEGMTAEQTEQAKRTLLTRRILCAALWILAAASVVLSVFLPGKPFFLAGAGALLCGGLAFLLSCKTVPKKYGLPGMKELREQILSSPAREEKRRSLMTRHGELRARVAELQAEETRLRDEVEQGIRSYRAEPGNDYDAQLQELLAGCNRLSELLYRAESAERNADAIAEGLDLSALRELAGNAPETTRERSVIEREEAFYRKQGELLADKKQSLDLQVASLEARAADPALLSGKKRLIDERIAEYKGKLASYEAAKAGIEQAADQMKSMVAPRISTLSGSYFAGVTGGKYASLDVDTRMAMSTREDGMTHDLDYLSAGTKDVAYLSLRLALSDLLFGGNGVPMVLDDAFGRLDDARLASALSLLAEAAKRHQLLLLTCTDREEACMKANGISYHKLEQKG